MSPSEELVRTIDTRIAQARKEIASLEAALAAMDGNAGRTPATHTPATRTPATRTPATRTPAGTPSGDTPAAPTRRRAAASGKRDAVPAGKLEALLASGDGMTTSHLAERSGGHRYQVLVLLRELEQAGRVRRTGERRGTRWHLVTDEDRIAARVAELKRQSTTFGRQQ